MQPYPSDLLELLCKDDVQAFLAEALATIEPGRELISSWHIEHICWLLSEVTRGAERRVIFNLPPRSVKSLLISVVYPAFRLGHDPSLRIVVASNTIELARKHAADFRRLTSSPFFRRLFPGSLRLSTSLLRAGIPQRPSTKIRTTQSAQCGANAASIFTCWM